MRKSAIVIMLLCGAVLAQFNQDTLKRWMKTGSSFDFILIDLRGPSDNITQVIANDVCKPYNLVWPNEFKASISKIQKDKHVVVYCRSGSRSSQAYSFLLGQGYANVYDAGGFMNWNDTVRAFSENTIMADSLLPAPSMVPFAGVKYAWFKTKKELYMGASQKKGNTDICAQFSLNGRFANNNIAINGFYIRNADLKLIVHRN